MKNSTIGSILRSLRLILGLVACTLGFCSEESNRKPNILLIMVDDLGKEWISCYGAEGIETPNIDRLAEEGIKFANAYSMPKCTPTRATLLTGQYPYRNGWVNHWDVPRWGDGCHFDPKHNLTFARILQESGYRTAIAGKWQINDFRVQPDILKDHGFDEWCMWTGYETGQPTERGDDTADPYIHTNDGSRTYEARVRTGCLCTDFLIDFMERHREDPMLLYFPMCLTHGPFVPTPDERGRRQGKDACFKAMVRYTDKLVGDLVQSLEDLGLRKDTYILFTTDNGTAGTFAGSLDGRKVRGGKGSLSENGINAPFIVSRPGTVPSGVTNQALTDFTDLFPTLLEFAGIEASPNWSLDGHSIAPVLNGETNEPSRDWILSMGGGVAKFNGERVVPDEEYADRAIRGERYKIIHTQKGTTALYDLENDPGEATNLIGSESADAMEARRHLEEAAQSMPEKDAAPRYEPNPKQTWDLSLKR